jgi:hypothetical protein
MVLALAAVPWKLYLTAELQSGTSVSVRLGLTYGGSLELHAINKM